MDYHRRTLELFGQAHLPLAPERAAAAARVAAAVGIALPRAVAEWYCIAEPSALWKSFCWLESPIFGPVDGAPQVVWSGRKVFDDLSKQWWEVPAVFHDVRGWIAEPVMPLMTEIYSAWWWGVVLNGAADPAAVISHDQGETWDFCGPSFSAYVFSVLFDAPFHQRDGFRKTLRFGEQIYGERRRRLRAEFHQEPTTSPTLSQPARPVERFTKEGERFRFENGQGPFERFTKDGERFRVETAHGYFSDWQLWASSRAGFMDLVDRLSRIIPAFTGLTPGGPLICIMPDSTAADIEKLYGSGDDDIPF